MDVIPTIWKPSFEDHPAATGRDLFGFGGTGPRLREYPQNMHREGDRRRPNDHGCGARESSPDGFLSPGRKRESMQSLYDVDAVNQTRADTDEKRPVGGTLAEFKRINIKWGEAFSG